MTNEEMKSIQEIQGTGGFRVIEHLVTEKMKNLESVMGINKDRLVAEQALARQLSVELLKEFLSEINLLSVSKETRKTYE